MTQRSKRLLLVAGILLGSVALAAVLLQMRSAPPKKDVQTLDPLVAVLELGVSTEQFTIQSQGTVRPRTRTVLSSEVSGLIVDISPKFIPGGIFAKDEVLLRIDSSDYSVAVDKAEALVAQRQIEFDGAEKLRSQGYRAEAELASAAAALAAAIAELENARNNLHRTEIRLPYEGMVLEKSADLGQFVNPGTELGLTFATDVAEVRLPLTDQELAFVEVPSPADIAASVAAGPAVTLRANQKGKPAEWQARIVRSEGVVDERSRVTYLVAQVEDPYRLHTEGPPLRMGTFVAAAIVGSTPVDVIRVPRDALRGSDQLIFVNDESKLELRSVEILRSDARFAYLSAGASAGERIAITPVETPTNGMAVRVQSASEDNDVIAGSSE